MSEGERDRRGEQKRLEREEEGKLLSEMGRGWKSVVGGANVMNAGGGEGERGSEKGNKEGEQNETRDGRG